VLAGAAAGLMSLVFAVVSLRSTGIFFAILTLVLAQLFYVLADSKLRTWTGGANGIPGVPRPDLFGIDLYNNWNFACFVTALAVAGFWISVLLRSSPFGLTLHAIRQNPTRARQIGFSVNGYLAVAFVISGIFSGVSGALNASLISFISPETLYWGTSGDVLMMTVIGGIGTAAGPLVGAAVVEGLKESLSSYSELWHGILGVLFCGFAILLPSGVWGLVRAGLKSTRKAT
jgi:branched-chain amino acid transport system permease protein